MKREKQILQELECIFWNSSTCEQTLYVLCCSLLHVAELQGAWFPLVNFVWIVTRQNVSYVFFMFFHQSSIGLWSRRSPRRGHWAIDLFAHWNLEETRVFPRVEQCVCSLGVHVPSPVWAFQSRIMAVGPNILDMFCDPWKQSQPKWGIECVMLQVWSAGFIVSVVSLAKLSGAVFYERGHHGPSLHALTERLADNFATTSADRSQKCHLDRTASSAALNLSESFWHWSHKSTLCQSSNFCRQLEMGLQSCIALQVSLQFLCFLWKKHFGLKRPLIDYQPAPDRRQLTVSTRIPLQSFLFHSSAF